MSTSTSSPAANALSSMSLSHVMANSLDKDASPQLKNEFDAIALACHAGMVAVGFRLVGLGEDDRIETESTSSNTKLLPSRWNANSGHYAFRYAHHQSSMEYLLNVTRMGIKAVVMGMGLGDDKACTFDVTARDYVSPGNLPATPVTGEKTEEFAARDIIAVFISNGRLSDLGSLLRLKLIQKLAPGLHKVGYEDGPVSATQRRAERLDRAPQNPTHDPLRDDRQPPALPYPLHDPLLQPRRPMPDPMPGFEDEFETQRGPRGQIREPIMPMLGERDLYPAGLGPHDPIYGGVGPGLGPMRGGGGMHPNFDDPLFTGEGRRGPGGYDPQAPPGSRYDPVGPGMGGHPRGAGMSGRPPNPFGGFGGGDFI